MSIYKKIHAVMSETGGIDKSMTVGYGTNAYKAVSEADVLNEIKPLLKKHGLVLFPTNVEVTERYDTFNTKNGESNRLMTQVVATYKLVDIDTGEFETLMTVGNGVDTQDKASGKAMTYAHKVLLQKTFMLFSGEDTDNEPSDDITAKNTVDTVAKDVKLITLKMVQDKAKEKGVSEPQILATLNKDTPEKEHINDLKLLSQAQLNGLYKRLEMVKK